MKRLLFSFVFVVLVVTALDASPYRYRNSVDFNYFYSSLSHYGEWIELEPNYIVWRPTFVGRNWSPYNEGRWVYTSYGWHWDSYEPFGWAVYHYGRWFYDDWYGWVWTPGYEWAPAWVEFRYDDLYIGWAPLPPYAEFRAGVGIHFTTNWHHHHSHWHFVSFHYFGYDNVNYYIENPRNNQRIFSRTKYRTNYTQRDGAIINNSIDRNVVERNSGRKVVERSINLTSDRSSAGRSGNSRTVNVYRPSDREVSQTRDIGRVEVIKSNRSSSLKTDKIAESNRTKINGQIVRRESGNNSSVRSQGQTRTDRNNNRAAESREGNARVDIQRKTDNNGQSSGSVRKNTQTQKNDNPTSTRSNRSYKKPESTNRSYKSNTQKKNEPATRSSSSKSSSTRSSSSKREPASRSNTNSRR